MFFKFSKRLEIHYTKYGSWLNIAEIELNVMTMQCLNRRIGDPNTLNNEVQVWQKTEVPIKSQ